MRVLTALVRLVAVLIVAGVGTAAVGVAAAPQVAKLVTAHDSTSSVPPLRPLTSQSYMYDGYGNLLAELKGNVDRRPVTLDQIPADVREAVIAVEDEGFYLHKGVSFSSLVRATLLNVGAGEIRQGGSTITQQVVKKNLLSDSQTADRKVKEAMYAIRLEEQLTKDEILELYLNTVYFGNGAYGVGAAAAVYFNKSVDQLTLLDGAFLAGMIRNPTAYDPFRFPDRSTARRRVALERLVDVGRLTPEEMEAAAALPLPAQRYGRTDIPAVNYFVEEVKQQLLDGEGGPILGDTDEERYDNLFYGGYRIYTTYDPILQERAQAAYDEVVRGLVAGTDTDAAIVAVEPTTGGVKAMVGGPGFAEYKYNLAVQGTRQPGSSFKTFVLMAALQAGVQPSDVIDGTSPCEFPNPGGKPDPYEVGARSGGLNTIAYMTAQSINCGYVRLGQVVGLQRVMDTARRMGVTSPYLNPDTPSAPLGTLEISPLEMASAYAVIAAGGVRHDRHYITKIEGPDGTVVYERGNPPGEQVFSPEVAAQATAVLQGVVTGGTGGNARLPDRPTAGKTGTSEDNGDAWFVGFTPQLATAVWMGNKADRATMNLRGVGAVQGSNVPSQLWGNFMAKASADVPPAPFPAAPPDLRPPVQVFLPGLECSDNLPKDPPWAIEEVDQGRGKPKLLRYLAPTDAYAPVPSVPAGTLVWTCADGKPRPTTTATTPRRPSTTTGRGGSQNTTPATTPAPAPPSSEEAGGGGGDGGGDDGGGDGGGGEGDTGD